MTYTPRTYDQLVRDLLTTLTGGTVSESLVAPPEGILLVPEKLKNRPVRRVSFLQGVTTAGVGPAAREVPYRFTSADFELVSTIGDPNSLDAIRFRETGRRPVPGSLLTINYYPVQTQPVPLTDLNVGSVIRTMLESVAREMAVSYQHLDLIYKSAYLETAEGSSLDKVVALVGVTRLPVGHPIASVRFSRRAGTPGRITVPAGTPIVDTSGNRYMTLEPLTLEPYETTREVLAGGESAATEEVEAGQLTLLEITIAGISAVTNPQPARRLSAPETDADLRRRARAGLQGIVRGTVDALRFGLLSLPEVKDVTIVEAPNGVHGEIRIDVAYNDNSDAARAVVRSRIDELRPAGVRVVDGEAARLRVGARVHLTLAGSGISGAELADVTTALTQRISAYLGSIPPGGTVRRARLSALALEDSRVADASVVLLPDGLDETEELTLAAGVVLEVIQPFSVPTPSTEVAPGTQVAVTSSVSTILPIHLAPGVTLADASAAIGLALNGFLSSRAPDAPLTVDHLAAAIRDDTRFGLIRSESLVTVETADGRFLQLTDGIGEYRPAPHESLQKGEITIDAREGGV